MSSKTIQLSQGGGSVEMNALLSGLFYQQFSNDILLKAEDAAVLQVGKTIAFSTDSFTVSPLFFAGGNIGKLAIAGTVNDLCMMGAKPLYLSCAFMIEEGFSYEALETIVASMSEELEKCGVQIVCGDTKVVPKGGVDKLFINTAGIGEIVKEGVSAHNLSDGDAIIVSRDIGRHGMAILASREGLEFEGDLKSDCARLDKEVEALINSGVTIKAMRDATRGGLSAVLNEFAVASDVCIEVQEEALPVSDEVRGICEVLGFEASELANEGTFIIAVDAKDVQKAVSVLQTFNSQASQIATVTQQKKGKVLLQSGYGSMRYMEWPKGEMLPRIC